MKQPVIAMKKHDGAVTGGEIKTKIKLPEGCTGILFCFESKKAARQYWGADVGLVEIKLGEKEEAK